MLVPAGKHPPYGSVLLEATSPVSGAVCCAISQEGHGGSGSSYGPRRWGLHSEAGCLGLRSPWGEKETPWGVSFPARRLVLLLCWTCGCLAACLPQLRSLGAITTAWCVSETAQLNSHSAVPKLYCLAA